MAIERGDGQGVTAVLPLNKSTHGVSGSFMVRADDGADYWCKAINNPAGSTRIPINEQIAGRIGALLGISTTGATLVRLDEIAGWEFSPGRHIETGWAHGSTPVNAAFESRHLDYRAEDNNRKRHVGFYALMDLLAGGDEQWLYSGAEENAAYSHDHGHYFPGGPDWTPESLAAVGVGPKALGVDPAGLDSEEIGRLADRMIALTRNEIEAELSKIPQSWPVDDKELDALADFLCARKEPAAGRLRSLVP